MAAIHDVIKALPDGYQTEIGERRVGLAGGEKQRPSPRGSSNNPSMILVLHRATSSLNAQTAEHLTATINQLTG